MLCNVFFLIISFSFFIDKGKATVEFIENLNDLQAQTAVQRINDINNKRDIVDQDLDQNRLLGIGIRGRTMGLIFDRNTQQIISNPNHFAIDGNDYLFFTSGWFNHDQSAMLFGKNIYCTTSLNDQLTALRNLLNMGTFIPNSYINFDNQNPNYYRNNRTPVTNRYEHEWFADAEIPMLLYLLQEGLLNNRGNFDFYLTKDSCPQCQRLFKRVSQVSNVNFKIYSGSACPLARSPFYPDLNTIADPPLTTQQTLILQENRYSFRHRVQSRSPVNLYNYLRHPTLMLSEYDRIPQDVDNTYNRIGLRVQNSSGIYYYYQ